MNVTNPRTLFLATGVLYLAGLLTIVGVGALTFRSLYTQMPSRPVIDEDVAIRTFELQYREAYDDYAKFMGPSGAALALYLGVWTGAFGVWRKKLWQGVAALAAGGAITILALALLPWRYFPVDQYSVAALWLMGSIVIIPPTWILATLLGRTLARRIA